jgi:DNA repair exonuclease SbcCD ATPase subunit
MEDSAPLESKTFTIPLDLIENGSMLEHTVLIDKVSELVLEVYEDGKYAYSKYQSQNKKVPEVHRQYKGKIRKFLHSLTTAKSFSGKVFSSFFEFLVDLDETVIKSMIQRNAEVRKKNREYKKELNELKPLYEDLKNNFDVKIDCEMQKEIQRQLDKEMKEERKHVLEQLKERLNIIQRLEDENVKLKNYHSTEEERLISDNVNLVEQIVQLKENLEKAEKKLEKGTVGRPKLSRKEKKKLKKEKLKKQLQELESSDSDSSSSDED